MSQLHFDHFDDDNTTDNKMMLLDIMTVDVLADSPGLDASIDSLMAGTGGVHCVVMLDGDRVPRNKNLVVTTVSAISNDFLSWSEHLLQLVAKNLDVGPPTTLKRASNCSNHSRLDDDGNLVPQPGRAKLVRIPLAIERRRLVNQKINTIDRNKTALSTVVN